MEAAMPSQSEFDDLIVQIPDTAMIELLGTDSTVY
jgi:hypothetical protein